MKSLNDLLWDEDIDLDDDEKNCPSNAMRQACLTYSCIKDYSPGGGQIGNPYYTGPRICY